MTKQDLNKRITLADLKRTQIVPEYSSWGRGEQFLAGLIKALKKIEKQRTGVGE